MKKLFQFIGVMLMVLSVFAVLAAAICHYKPESCVAIKLRELAGKCCNCCCKSGQDA